MALVIDSRMRLTLNKLRDLPRHTRGVDYYTICTRCGDPSLYREQSLTLAEMLTVESPLRIDLNAMGAAIDNGNQPWCHACQSFEHEHKAISDEILRIIGEISMRDLEALDDLLCSGALEPGDDVSYEAALG